MIYGYKLLWTGRWERSWLYFYDHYDQMETRLKFSFIITLYNNAALLLLIYSTYSFVIGILISEWSIDFVWEAKEITQ